MKFKYKNKEYKIGQKIKFTHFEFTNAGTKKLYYEAIGKIVFCRYPDEEQYSTGEHLGILVRFSYIKIDDFGERIEKCSITFPDFIHRYGDSINLVE